MTHRTIREVNEHLFGGWELALLGVAGLNIFIGLSLLTVTPIPFFGFLTSWIFGCIIIARFLFKVLVFCQDKILVMREARRQKRKPYN